VQVVACCLNLDTALTCGSDEHVVSHHIMWRTEIIPDPKTETDTYDNIFTKRYYQYGTYF
jgi:hypothetical protein